MSKRVAIVNMSDRKDAMIAVAVMNGDEDVEFNELAPGEAITLDREDFEKAEIRDVGDRGGERFKGQKTKQAIAPVITPHFRTSGGMVDHPIEPEPDEDEEE